MRSIEWDGFCNARDLGGLPTAGGGRTRTGVLIRSADPRFVTADGWRAARAAGVRTIIDLRNDDEVPPGDVRLPAGLNRVHVPLDGVEDVELWRYLNEELLNGTPLYYPPFLARQPARCAAAVTAVARAEPGGVVFHCGVGRDRTGLLALLLLSLAGVEPPVLADDYELGAAGVAALYARLGRDDPTPRLQAVLAGKGTTTRAAILSVVEGFDAEGYLLAAGVTADDIAAIRERLTD
ncbi:tyrosine-protein phosphatase [Dactylosporangium sp. NPDC051541]|uniref:tyrosine-protein phosphatase n=1 Tax=Dactylosporangium sp. NPDC051541 TaxID=3363977 RepID=UPI00379E6828